MSVLEYWPICSKINSMASNGLSPEANRQQQQCRGQLVGNVNMILEKVGLIVQWGKCNFEYITFKFQSMKVVSSICCEIPSGKCCPTSLMVNSLRQRQNGHHFADGTSKRFFFLNENVWILIKISVKFIPKGPINNMPALVQIMAWCQPGDKPLSEPMMVRLPMGYMHHLASIS